MHSKQKYLSVILLAAGFYPAPCRPMPALGTTPQQRHESPAPHNEHSIDRLLDLLWNRIESLPRLQGYYKKPSDHGLSFIDSTPQLFKLSLLGQLPALALSLLAASPLETASRILHAKSLAANSSQAFCLLQKKALKLEEAQRQITIAALASSIGGFAGTVIVKDFAYDSSSLSATLETNNESKKTTGLILGLTTTWWGLKLAQANRRTAMHKKYIENSSYLHALMQTKAFMDQHRITSWKNVAAARLKKEKIALWTGLGGATLSVALTCVAKHKDWPELMPLSFLVNPVVIKPLAALIARRKKREAPGIEKALNAAIAAKNTSSAS